MWPPSAAADGNSNAHRRARASSSSSSSSFVGFSSSSSSSTSVAVPQTLTHDTMEEVWDDINLASIPPRHLFRSIILQDFLAGSFNNSLSVAAIGSELSELPLPPTVLSLGTGLSCNAGANRHYKRMMKNRESAARSRARKQAYTHELQLEVDRLAEENSMLKKQNEQLRVAMAAQNPKKKVLQRTSSAPF